MNKGRCYEAKRPLPPQSMGLFAFTANIQEPIDRYTSMETTSDYHRSQHGSDFTQEPGDPVSSYRREVERGGGLDQATPECLYGSSSERHLLQLPGGEIEGVGWYNHGR